MSIPVRTLSPQDAEIMARTTKTGVVSGGCVECHGLRWRSDALRTWEVEQRSLERKPEVSIRIDELDLSIVYVEALHGERRTYRATSTQPMYTKRLSLFEHGRLKAVLKKKDINDRLVRMSDEQAFNLRIEYHAALGRADDPIAYRRLVELRDALAALRAQDTGRDSPDELPPASPSKPVHPPATKKKATPKRASGQGSQPEPEPPVKAPQTVDSPAKPPASEPTQSQPPPAKRKPDAAPVISFPQISIKRKPK